MKTVLAIAIACGVGLGAGYVIVGKRMLARHAEEIAAQQNAWQAERAALEAALEATRDRPHMASVSQPVMETVAVPATAKTSADELVARLRNARFLPGGQPRVMRQIVHDLEELSGLGSAALPAIREFLSRNEDVDYTLAKNERGTREAPLDFVTPPSFRFGLFEVVRQIGGPDAEKILADTLSATTRGSEVIWLARALQEIAPDKYRDAALLAARGMLDRNPDGKSGNADREQAFRLLAMFNDASCVAVAQAQLIRTDGQVDKSAMHYLLQTLGRMSFRSRRSFTMTRGSQTRRRRSRSRALP